MTGREIVQTRLGIDPEAIDGFCLKWRIRELSLFGSALRDDFRVDSDVDLLVSFESPNPWTLWDFVDMKDELERIFGRPVDLISRKGLTNPSRRQAILTTQQVIYAA
ncbi:MAG TPA: nucleotidyltransferase family protein [Thermoanaerobaculia bacterium]|nr:nucleotidyltransferase family protein [Thermoanaerobaculia bacterium]